MTRASTRLTGDEIKHLVTQGKRKDSHFFVLYWIKTEKPEFKKVVIIAKQFDKRAVFRNRLRRVINEHLRAKHHDLIGIKLAIKPKKAARGLSPLEIRNEISVLLQHINTKS